MDSDLVDVADSRTRMEAFVHGIGIIVAAFAVGFALAFVALTIASSFVQTITPDGDLTQAGAVVSFVFQFTGFILTVWAYIRRRDGPPLFGIDVPSLRDVGVIVGGFLVLIVASIVMSNIVEYLGYQSAQNSVVKLGSENPELFLYMIPISILLVGPGEELLFRGAFQGLFRRAYGPAPAVLASGVGFGLVHYVALLGDGKLIYIGVAAVLGIVLATLYELTENVAVPAVVHGCYNALLFLGQWISNTQDVQLGIATLF